MEISEREETDKCKWNRSESDVLKGASEGRVKMNKLRQCSEGQNYSIA